MYLFDWKKTCLFLTYLVKPHEIILLRAFVYCEHVGQLASDSDVKVIPNPQLVLEKDGTIRPAEARTS